MTTRASATRVFTPHSAGLFNQRAAFWIGDTAQKIVAQRKREYEAKKEAQRLRRERKKQKSAAAAR